MKEANSANYTRRSLRRRFHDLRRFIELAAHSGCRSGDEIEGAQQELRPAKLPNLHSSRGPRRSISP